MQITNEKVMGELCSKLYRLCIESKEIKYNQEIESDNYPDAFPKKFSTNILSKLDTVKGVLDPILNTLTKEDKIIEGEEDNEEDDEDTKGEIIEKIFTEEDKQKCNEIIGKWVNGNLKQKSMAFARIIRIYPNITEEYKNYVEKELNINNNKTFENNENKELEESNEKQQEVIPRGENDRSEDNQ